MRKFAFICHPHDLNHIRQGFPWLWAVPDPVLKAVSPLIPPAVVSHITGIKSPISQTEGWLIGVHLTTAQIVSLSEELVLKRLIQAGKLAKKLGAQVLGLAARVAAVGDGGAAVAKKAHIPVTTGNSYTVGMALAATELAAEKRKVAINQADVLVINADVAIGAICCRILARKANYLTLVGENSWRLKKLAEQTLRESGVAVRIAVDVKAALGRSDVIVIVTGSMAPAIQLEELKEKALICDLAWPRAIAAKDAARRSDLLIIEGGLVRVPGVFSTGLDFGYPSATAPASMAEAMILALEGRQGDFTSGKELTVGQVDKIMRLANKHKFQLAGLRSFGRTLHFS